MSSLRGSDRLRAVMQLAFQEAMRCEHGYIGTEHLLLALAKERGSAAAELLAAHGLDLRTLRDALCLGLRAPALNERLKSHEFQSEPGLVLPLTEGKPIDGEKAIPVPCLPTFWKGKEVNGLAPDRPPENPFYPQG